MRLVRSCNPSSSPHCPSPCQASLDAGLSRDGSHLDVKYISRSDRRRTCADVSPAHRRDGERRLPHRSEGGRNDPGSPYWRDDDRNGDCRSRYVRDLSCKVNHPSKRDLFSSRCSSSERSDASLPRVSSLRCYAPRSHADAREGNDERYSIERYHSDGHGGKRAKRDQISSSINGSSRHTSLDLSPIHDSKKLNQPLRLFKEKRSPYPKSEQERQTESRHGSTTTWNRIEYGPLNDHAAGRQQRFEQQQSLNRQFFCAVKETSDTDVGQQQEKHKQLCGLGNPSVPHKDKELSKNEIRSSPEDAVKVTDEFVVSEMKEIIQPEVNVLRLSRDAAADAIIIGDGHVVAKEETVLHTLDTLHEVESKSNQTEHQLASEDPYLMLASLLLEDSLDVECDFEVTLAPGEYHPGLCGSIFEDAIDFGDNDDTGNEMIVDEKNVKEDLNAEASKHIDMSDPSDRDRGCSSSIQDCGKTSARINTSKGCKSNAGIHKAEAKNHRQQINQVLVDVTNKFKLKAVPVVKKADEENDAHRLSQRMRQIEFGKNTLGYDRYIEVIPRHKRKRTDPATPNPKQVCSKRSWDGQIRKWRRLLHVYDPPMEDGEEMAEDFTGPRPGHTDTYPEINDDNSFSPKEDTKHNHRAQASIAEEIKIAGKGASLSIYDDWVES